MVKRYLLPLSIALTALLLLPTLLSTPFEMRVIDERTGTGIPVRVTADNGIARDTPNGYLYWWAPSLMRRTVRFEIKDERNQFDNMVATVRLTPGGNATLRLHRRS